MTDFYSTLVDRALNRIYGEELGPEQPKDTTIGGLGGRPMSELEGTTTAADAAEPEMPVATDAVLNAVNKMKDYTTKPLANITYVPLKAASKEASLRRNTMLDLLLAGEEEGALPDGFAKMYDYGEVEFSALDYLDKLKSDYDRKTKATIDVPMQDKRVMDTVDPQFPMPTSTREPQYVSLEDATDADIVLDEPVEVTEEDVFENWIDKAADRIAELEGFIPEAKIAFEGEMFPTIGYGRSDKTVKLGQKITQDEAKEDLKNNLIPSKIKIAKRLFPNYDSFSDNLKVELLQGIFRGDFKAGHETVKLINKGSWEEASEEFLNHKEYLKALNDPDSDRKGIIDRLQSISRAIREEATN
jgi:GH24 family phage-related lysozyme (muramidase)